MEISYFPYKRKFLRNIETNPIVRNDVTTLIAYRLNDAGYFYIILPRFRGRFNVVTLNFDILESSEFKKFLRLC